MRFIKDITQESEMYFTGLGVFVGLPFLAAFLLGRNFSNMIAELILSMIAYTVIFVWISRGGLEKK